MNNYPKRLLLLLLYLFLSLSGSTQNISAEWFDRPHQFLSTHVKDGKIDYQNLKENNQLQELVMDIAQVDLSTADSETTKAFYLNAYNLLVIYAVAEAYPIASVQNIGGFFDRKKYLVGGEKMTLDQLEKDLLLKKYPDSRLHFALVCGAVGCPPILNKVYRPATLNQQLDEQTRRAVNDPEFVAEKERKVWLSKIFQWYAADFGGNKKAVLAYINQYRDQKIPANAKISYWEYNWGLNDWTENKSSPNSYRYVTSATIPKGQIELKWFNNLYSQRVDAGVGARGRSTFFTSTLSGLYGVSPRFNAGLSLKYRRVHNGLLPNDALDVFGKLENPFGRSGITGIGPMIRWTPVQKWSGFSMQSTFTIPVGESLAGNGNDLTFIDWNGSILFNQFFYDRSIGTQFALFTELDLVVEDIGNSWRTSTPATIIFSYFPVKKWTLYGLLGYAPVFQKPYDYYHQAGLGTKYQITRKLELELLYVSFRTRFVKANNGVANTFNFGVRGTL